MKNFNEFILEQNSYKNNFSIEKEVNDFTIVDAEFTRLPYDLYIDSYKYYKYYNHKPWLYVKVNNNFIPITISDNPSIVNANKNVLNKDEFEKIRKFIIANKNLLLKYADDLLDDSIFFDSLQKVNESSYENEAKDFTLLDTELTGLPYDLYADSCGYYKFYKHEKLLYAKVGNNFIPITISDYPKNKDNKKINNEDFEKIKKFIVKHKRLLSDYCDSKLSDKYFFNTLKINESEELNEMAILRTEDSGIPFRIWIDDGGTWKNSTHNKPRLKIQDEDCSLDSNDWLPILFEEPYQTPNGQTMKMNAKKFNLFLTFVRDEENNKNILKVLNGEMKFRDFVNVLHKVDKHGNIIKNTKDNAKEQTN